MHFRDCQQLETHDFRSAQKIAIIIELYNKENTNNEQLFPQTKKTQTHEKHIQIDMGACDAGAEVISSKFKRDMFAITSSLGSIPDNSNDNVIVYMYFHFYWFVLCLCLRK